jgi:hypothetical protein
VAFAKGVCLTNRTQSIFFIFMIMLCFGSFAISRAGDSTGVSSMSVVRSQLHSIAREVVDQAKLDPQDRVGVFVEGEGPLSLVENAFIEELQQRNYRSILGTGIEVEQTVHVLLLGMDIKVRGLDTKWSERSICTNLEVRTVTGTEREARILGTFLRETKDTAQVFPSVQLSAVPKDDKSGVVPRILTPLIVITGAMLIVYLFFTVRS